MVNIIQFLSSFSCIIPILIYLFNVKIIEKEIKWIFYYLILCLIMEVILNTNFLYYKYNLTWLMYLFTYAEALIFLKLIKQENNKYLYYALTILILILFVQFMGNLIYPIELNINIHFGIGKLILLIIAVYTVIESLKNEIENWRKYLGYSLLQYSMMGMAIYTFFSYFIENKNHAIYFLIGNAIVNIIFYILLSITILKGKKSIQ